MARFESDIEQALANAPFMVEHNGVLISPTTLDRMQTTPMPAEGHNHARGLGRFVQGILNRGVATPADHEQAPDDEPFYLYPDGYKPAPGQILVANTEDLLELQQGVLRAVTGDNTLELPPVYLGQAKHEEEHWGYAKRFVRAARICLALQVTRYPEPYNRDGEYGTEMSLIIENGRTARLDWAAMAAYPTDPSYSDIEQVKSLGYTDLVAFARKLQERGRPVPRWFERQRSATVREPSSPSYITVGFSKGGREDVSVATVASALLGIVSALPAEELAGVRHRSQRAFGLLEAAAYSEGNGGALDHTVEEITEAVENLLGALTGIDGTGERVREYLESIGYNKGED